MMDSLKYEADTELYNLSEIYCKMEKLAEETFCYTQKYLKVGLPEHYGEHIFFAEQPGWSNHIWLNPPLSTLRGNWEYWLFSAMGTGNLEYFS